MKIFEIKGYPEYQLYYSDDEQLVYSKKSGKYLKNRLNNKGYYHVTLCNDKGAKTWRLNRLVWYCINGEIPENLQVNHINECKLDNRIDNLNLMTCKENIEYSKAISIVGINKTTFDIIEFSSSREAQRKDKKFNQAHIIKCCKHKIYKTVNGYYFFYKSEFDELLEKYQGNIDDIIKYKLSKY